MFNLNVWFKLKYKSDINNAFSSEKVITYELGKKYAQARRNSCI